MKVFLQLLFIVTALSVFAQEDPSKDKQPKTFSLNPNDLGALENSVNLFTGQVAFSMNLASLPDRGGLNVSVNIQYNSNVARSVDKRNLEAPTGIVGLGWSLDVPKIVVNNKMTGSRSDDEFYLVEGGQSKKLVCVNSENYPRTYEVKSPDLWKVEYYHYDEKWVITRENGFKYVFGDDNSSRNTIQWMVRWGNWIGNSVMATGQEQQAYIWNISEVENLWGDKLRFEYEVVEEFVAKDLAFITSHKKHTKASYLKRITGPAGYSVEFLYGEKLNETGNGRKEYQDPHIEKAEPDAYQEKYESRYLDRLIVTSHDGSLLYETDLDYDTDLIGSGNTVKRVLTSINNIYPSGRSLPPVRFEYFTSGDFTGSLKKVTNSYGAYYEYTYEKSEIPFSDLDVTVDAPTPGQWKEHYVYPGNDYAIVVWRTVNADGSHNPDFRPCKIWLYYWDGRWTKKDLTANTQYGQINIKTRENDEGERVLDWQIALGEYFFAYMYPESGSSNKAIKVWYRTESAAPDWQLQSLSATAESALLSGDHFLATYSIFDPIIKTWVFNGNGMRSLDIDASDEDHEYFVSAAKNYIFVHNDNGSNQDFIHVFHLSEDRKWIKTSAPSSQLFDTDGDGIRLSYWHSFNSFTMGLPWDNEEFIYSWDTNFNAIRRSVGWGRRKDNSYVFSRDNSLLSIVPRESSFAPSDDSNSISARFNGSGWQLHHSIGPQRLTIFLSEQISSYATAICLTNWKKRFFRSTIRTSPVGRQKLNSSKAGHTSIPRMILRDGLLKPARMLL